MIYIYICMYICMYVYVYTVYIVSFFPCQLCQLPDDSISGFRCDKFDGVVHGKISLYSRSSFCCTGHIGLKYSKVILYTPELPRGMSYGDTAVNRVIYHLCSMYICLYIGSKESQLKVPYLQIHQSIRCCLLKV